MNTREALFSLQVLLKRCRYINKLVWVCFLNYNKAFDNEQHAKTIQILQELCLDSKDISLIKKISPGVRRLVLLTMKYPIRSLSSKE